MRFPLCVTASMFTLVLASLASCGGGQSPSARGSETQPTTQVPAPPSDAQPAAAPDATTAADTPPLTAELLPRSLFFGNPDRTYVRLSPDGQRIAWLAPHDGVLNVFVAPVDDIDAAVPKTSETARSVAYLSWAWTNEHLIYAIDPDGDENAVIHVMSLEDGESRTLTPEEGVSARLQQRSRHYPEEVLISMNDRVPENHDVYRVNIITGERTRLLENPGFFDFTTGDDLAVHFGVEFTPDGGFSYLRPDESGDGFEPAIVFPMEDTISSRVSRPAPDGESYLTIDTRDRDTAALVRLSASGEVLETLHSDPRADVSGFLVHPTTGAVEAVAVEYVRTEWILLDDALAEDWDALASAAEGDFEVVSRSLDDDRWLVAYTRDDGPYSYYLYERDARELSFLFTHRSALEGVPLLPKYPLVIQARDGLEMVSYLTLPRNALGDDEAPPREMGPMSPPSVSEPLPMVLLVHGGPYARDSWGFDSFHQWLASRGYAVLSVNFRGSTGFGKEFVNASTLEWGGAMQEDLVDAVEWAIEHGIAHPDQIAIKGGSFGGYSALYGLAFTPDIYACGVSWVGISNLVTFLESMAPTWAPFRELLATRVGDVRTEEGRALLESQSPLNRVDDIRRPLLIGQGANDPRVRVSESDQIARAMAERGTPFTYALFPDEGHGFARSENRLAFYAVTEEFLGECLGGAVEPVGDAFSGSSIRLIEADELEQSESNGEDEALREVDSGVSSATPSAAE